MFILLSNALFVTCVLGNHMSLLISSLRVSTQSLHAKVFKLSANAPALPAYDCNCKRNSEVTSSPQLLPTSIFGWLLLKCNIDGTSQRSHDVLASLIELHIASSRCREVCASCMQGYIW